MKIKIGMKVCVQVYWGTITEINTYKCSHGINKGKEVTRFRVRFDPCDISNTVYDNSNYGCITEALEQFYAFKEV